MSKDTDNSLFIVSSMPQLYQHLVSGLVNYEALGNRIITQIKRTHAFRRVEQVKELSRLLLNIPIKEYQLVAHYYLYWCRYRNHEYDVTSLETIIDHTQTYKAQALLSRGALEYDNKRNPEALYFFAEALKANPNVSEYIAISIAIAVVKAAEGLHHLALSDLEKLVPIVKHAEPRLYYDFLNSYAVELAEAGRKQEARNISRFVLASPFAQAYPEWHETARDLKEPNRSFIGIDLFQPVYTNVVRMPVAEHSIGQQISYGRPARVLSLQQWKKKMRKELNGDEGRDKGSQEMNESEMIYRIINLFTNPDTSEQKRFEMLEAVEKIASKPCAPKLDDANDDLDGA